MSTNAMEEIKDNRDLSILNFIINLPATIHIPYYIFWISLLSLLLLLMVNFSKSIEGLRLEFVLPSLIMMGAAWLAISIAWSMNRLKEFCDRLAEFSKNPEATKKWLYPYIENIYSSKHLFMAGLLSSSLLVTLVAYYSNWLSSPIEWYSTIFSKILFFILWGIATFFVGAGISVVIGTMTIPVRISKEDLRLSLHSSKKFGIKRIGGLYLRFAVIISGATSISITGVLVSPIAKAPGLIMMYLLFSCLSFIYFIVTQWSLHKVLLSEKSSLLDDINIKMEHEIKSFREKADDTSELGQRINTLLNLRREILNLSEWPFDISTIIKALLSSLGPVLVIVTKFWDVIAKYLGIT